MGSAGNERHWCFNLFPNHKVDQEWDIRYSLEFRLISRANGYCNVCISKIPTSFPSPVSSNTIVLLD